MNSIEVKDVVSIGINENIGRFIEANQVHKKPNYPFATFKVITSYSDEKDGDILVNRKVASDNPIFEYDIQTSKIEQPTMTMSINAYSNDEVEAYELAEKIKNWLEFKGEFYLDANGIVIVNTTDIQNREVLIVDNYECRQGFDLIIRFDRTIERRVETIENVKPKRI